MYNSIEDAKTAMQSSGVYEMFGDMDMQEVYEKMFHEELTPGAAAWFFEVRDA